MRYTKKRKKTSAVIAAAVFLTVSAFSGTSGPLAGEMLLEYEQGSETDYFENPSFPVKEEPETMVSLFTERSSEEETITAPERTDTEGSSSESETALVTESIAVKAAAPEPASEEKPESEKESIQEAEPDSEKETMKPETEETKTETVWEPPAWDDGKRADPGRGDIIIREIEDGILVKYEGDEYLASHDTKIGICGMGDHDCFVSVSDEVTLVLEGPLKAGSFRAEGDGKCILEIKDPNQVTQGSLPDNLSSWFTLERLSLAGNVRLEVRPLQNGLFLETDRIDRGGNCEIISPEGSLIEKTVTDETEITEETEMISDTELTAEVFTLSETEPMKEERDEPAAAQGMLLKSTPGTNEYGTDPFELEYSSGAIISVGADSIRCSGMSGPVTMTNAGAGTSTTIYIANNTQKSANVYKDFYGGAVMGQERYDVRVYSWGLDDAGQGYAVMPMGYGALGASANTYSNGAVYTHSPTKIWLEYHFYKEGTLKTSSPQEVSFKGTVRYDDIDLDEGYAFIQGYNGAWTDKDSTIRRTTDSQTGLTWYLGTKNTEVGMSSVTQTIWVQVNSSKSVPYTCVYDARTSFASSASASAVSITYKLTPKSAVPSSFALPPGEAYHAKYGSYKVEKVQKIPGYTFRGWNTSQDLTGNTYADSQTIVTSSNLTLWGEYSLDTADITVSKSVVIPEGSIYSADTPRPLKGEGIAFELTGKGTAGINTQMYAVTGSSGTAVFKNVPLSTEKNYTIREVEESTVREAAKSGNASAAGLADIKITPLSWFTQPVSVSTSLGASGQTVKIENRMRRWKLKVWKTDSILGEKKRAQGEASIEGAVYALYDKDKQAAVYTTNEDGYFETGEFLPGDSWTLREIKAPEGYLADPAPVKILAGPQDLTGSGEVVYAKLEASSGSGELTADQVMRGRIVITKMGGMSEKTAKPLEGAGFGIYAVSDLNKALGIESGKAEDTAAYISTSLLDESGTFYKMIRSVPTACVYADPADKDVAGKKLAASYTYSDGTRINAPQGGYICTELRTDENGKAVSPLIPYGEYIVVETSTPPGFLCAEPVVVRITQDVNDKETVGDGKGSGDLSYLITNEPVMTALEIIKTDSLTGKDVSIPGAEFVIHDTDHAWADQTLALLTEDEQAVYHEKYGDLIVDAEGNGSYSSPYVTKAHEDLPARADVENRLPPGRYALEEVKAPEGFVCHGYEGEFRIDDNKETFWEAEDMKDSKWTASIRTVDETRTGIWKDRYDSKPVLYPFEINSENTVYDTETKSFRSRVRMENERFYGKISVFIQKERLKEYLSAASEEEDGAFAYETVPAKGCSFEVKALENIIADGTVGKPVILYKSGETVCTLTSDENGEAWTDMVVTAEGTSLTGLPGGKYELVMTGPEGLLVREPDPSRIIEITFRDDKTPLVFEDELYKNLPLRSGLSARKADAYTGEYVEGAVIGLYTASPLKDDEGTVKVDADILVGKTVSKKSPVSFTSAYLLDGKEITGPALPEGEYYTKELFAPDGYYPSDERTAVKEPGMDAETVCVLDVPIEGRFFLKDDLTFNELADAHFAVYDKDGKEVDTFITTNTSGKGYLIKGLRSGQTYTVEERIPREGYTNIIRDRDGKETGDENRMQFTVPSDPKPFTVTVYNAFITGNINLVKSGDKLRSVTDGDTDLISTLFGYEKENLAGAEFTVYAAEDIPHPDGVTGTVIYKNKTAGMNVRGKSQKAVGVTDENGQLTFTQLYPGHYKVVETAAPEGFVRVKEPLDLYIDASGVKDQETEARTKAAVHNPRQQIEVRVLKKDSESGKSVGNALFGLYANSDIRSSEGTLLLKKGDLIEQVLTGNDGAAAFKAKLPHGKYLVREITAPPGYVKSAETFSFEAVWKDGQKEKLSFSHTFLNDPIRVEVTKEDKNGQGTLPGAELVLLSPDGKVIEEWTSSEKPHVIRCLAAGTAYTLREISPPPGWASSPDVVFTVLEPASGSGVLQAVKMEDSPIIIDITVREKDPSGNGKTVEGVRYHLVDEKGNMIVIDGSKMVFVSKDGANVIEKIPAGNYTVITDSVPDGYLKPDPVKIRVEDTTDLQHFKILLEKAPKAWSGSGGGQGAVKTGDETPIGRIVLMMGISAFLTIISAVWIKKRES